MPATKPHRRKKVITQREAPNFLIVSVNSFPKWEQ
jgi:hypothetical protein